MSLTVGFDPSWSGVGWCIARDGKPLAAGWYKPGTWRESDLLEFLRGQIEPQLVELQAQEPPGALPVRVVVERLPWSYRRPGSQVRTVYGISGCAHVIVALGCRRGWRYPWQVPPSGKREKPGWRQWWGIRGKGRAAKKANAVFQVEARGWGGYLAGLAPLNATGDGAQGDCAEGILIAVGASTRPAEGPKGPAAWRRKR